MRYLIKKFRNSSLRKQSILSVSFLALYFISSHILENYYQSSKFPVPYFIQQTSFDALKMKEWYAFMIKENTFGIYLQTQFIDFLFIISVILAGFSLWTFVANLHHHKSYFREMGYISSFALPIAGGFDILENIISFFMIFNPINFNNNLIIPYSAFAVLKFAFWTIGLIWLIISFLVLIIRKLKTVIKNK